MASSYLDIALAILRRVKAPLSSREILNHAYLQRIVPHQLFGKTQHKTLGARLSEDIRHHGPRSQFYRTRAGQFYLRELLSEPGTPETFATVYDAPRREKQLGREQVLTLPTNAELPDEATSLSLEEVRTIIDQGRACYRPKRAADRASDLLQILVYVIVRQGHLVLTSKASHGRLHKDLVSIGFRGNLTDQDADLFNQEHYGLVNAGLRVLHEEVGLSARQTVAARTEHRIYLHHFLYLRDAHPAFRHLAAIVSYHSPPEFVPARNSNRLSWMDLRNIPNDTSKFDPWSQALLDSQRLLCMSSPH